LIDALFEFPNGGITQNYSPTRDGRFLININPEQRTNASITVVLNWEPPAK